MTTPIAIELHGPQPDDDEFDIADEDIAEAMKEADAIWSGDADPSTYVVHHPPGAVDVRAIRDRTGLSQTAFAERFGFSFRTLQQWEQGRRQPEGPARTLLKIIDQTPEAVEAALAAE